MRRMVVPLAALLIASAPCAAQRVRLNEYAGGAAANVLLRGPWMAKGWRRPVPRLLIFSVLSRAYEDLLDPFHPGDARQGWVDWGQREAGYLLCEGLFALVRRRW